MGRGTPDLRAQDTHRPPAGVQDAPQVRGDHRFSQEGRVGLRHLRHRPQQHEPLARPGRGGRPRPEGREAQGHRGHRRRVAHRRHGLRGDQPDRPHAKRPHHHPQRQRAFHLEERGRHVDVPHPDHLRDACTTGSGSAPMESSRGYRGSGTGSSTSSTRSRRASRR